MLLAALNFSRIVHEIGWWLGVPLLICSFVVVFVIFERCYALRSAAVMPEDLAEAVIEGRTPITGDKRSSLGRVLNFAARHVGDAEATKAYARLEVIKMERGVSYLDTVYACAPLFGLIGTVTGLLEAFSVVDPQTRMPDPVKFTESVGFALSATIVGLCIAVPALIGSGYLQRKVEKHAARLDVLMERVLARHATNSTATQASPTVASRS